MEGDIYHTVYARTIRSKSPSALKLKGSSSQGISRNDSGKTSQNCWLVQGNGNFFLALPPQKPVIHPDFFP